MKKNLSYFFIIVFFNIFVSNLLFANIYKINKHIIILYDFSGSVLRQGKEVRRANKYLTHFICEDSLREESRLSENDYIVNRLKNFKFSEPLYQSGDIISFFAFGINNDGIATVTAASTTPSVFLDNFANELIKNLGTYPNTEDKNLEEFLTNYYPNLKTPKYNYTFSRYILPLALRVIPQYYPEHTIFIIVSDFKSGTDEANLADQLLIERFFLPYLNSIKRLEENFDTIYTLNELMTLNVGTVNGILIKAIEISCVASPQMTFHSEEKPILKKINIDEYRLPKIKFIFKNMENFRVVERYLLLNFPKSNQLKQYKTQFVKGSLSEGQVTVAELLIPKKDIPKKDETVTIKLKLDGIFNHENLQLSNSIESNEIIIPIQHVPTSKAGRIILIIFGCVAIGAIVWGLAFRKPKIVLRVGKTFEHLEDDPHTIIIEWARRKCRIPVSLKNKSNILSLKYPTPVITIDTPQVPEEYGETIKIYLLSENCEEEKIRDFGEEIRFEKLKPQREKNVFLIIDLEDFPEPQDQTDSPIVFTVNYKPDIKSDFIPELKYSIIIKKSLGPFWIGIDPGTTASCIAGGDQLSNIELVKFYNTFVIPSFVSIRKDFKIPEGMNTITQFTEGIECGQQAKIILRSNKERTFYSAKKLIGYDVKRKIKLNGRTIFVSGQDAVKILSDYLIKEARKYFTAQNPNVLINKAAVAVPNNFTPLKISKMVEAVKNSSGIEKVYHVYEAEAVTLYYLSNYIKFNENRRDTIISGVRENVFVFDFGGGTVNVSVIGLTRPFLKKDKTKLEILSRVGYAIGGETFDRIIAEIIWKKLGENIKHFSLPSPFTNIEDINSLNEKDKDEWFTISLNLKDIAEELKIKLADNKRLSTEQYELKYNEEKSANIVYDPKIITSYNFLSQERQKELDKILENREINIEFDEILNNNDIKEILNILEESVDSALNIYFEKNLEPIHTVIFTGRSSFFPTVRERIIQRVEGRNKGEKIFDISTMGDAEVKYAVAYGTAYYAAEQQNIILSKTKTLANYGYIIIDPLRQGEGHFRNVIPINTTFDEESDKVSRSDKNQNVKHNSGLIRLYQVNCEKTKVQEIFDKKEKVKYNKITEVQVFSDNIKNLTITLDSKDKLSGKVIDEEGEQLFSANIEIKDILTDYDEKSTWLLG